MSKRSVYIIIFLLFSSLCVSFLCEGACHAEKRFIIKFATVAPEGSAWVKHMKRLDRRLREKSKGRVLFRIYAGGIAGDELDVLKKIRIGQIHCAAFSGVGIAQILPMVRVLDLPFLFRNRKEIEIVQSELLDFFRTQFRKVGFEFLAWAEVGNVHLFSKKPIRRKDDLSGLRIWTWAGDPISKKTFSSMGTTPIPLSITDVTTALNTNMIDTVYAPPLGALALQWHSYVNYMTSQPLAHATGAVLISGRYLKRFPDELVALIGSEFNKAMTDLASELTIQNEEAVKLIQKGGVKITPGPVGSDLDDFQGIHDRVAKELSGKVYPKALLYRIYKILNRVREGP